jgi:hypothetical protein
MNGYNKENPKELFEKFLNPEDATDIIDALDKAGKLLRQNPAPEPDKHIITNIKQQIEETLAARKRVRNFRNFTYKVAVAAAFIIIAAIGSTVFKKGAEETTIRKYASIIPRAVWESEDITATDADLARLTAEMEQIEDEMLTLETGRNGNNAERAVSELEMEMELIAINIDLGKE